MTGLTECKHMFSNGTDYECFVFEFCENCTRFRNERCRIFNRLELARFDENVFPYNELAQYSQTGKIICKSFTTEKPVKKWHRKQVDGQTEMEV